MVNQNKKNIGAILQPVFAVLVALPAISSLGMMMAGGGWDEAEWDERFANLPQTIRGIGVGMSDLEVKIAIGEPDVDKAHPSVWLYSGGDLYIRFDEKNRVSAVCYPPVADNPVLDMQLTEREVKARFGEPVHESIHASGLKKMMNYNTPQYSFGIQLNEAQLVCIHDGQGMIYDTEYKGANLERISD
jgi:hypothetical protein